MGNQVNHTTFTIEIRRDRHRLCGWRQPGGLYLVTPPIALTCGRLPAPLTPCPTCGRAPHFTRGWQWFSPAESHPPTPCPWKEEFCHVCPLADPPAIPRSGLLWVGHTHYPTPFAFLTEATRQGISKRVPHLPKGFTIGETRVFLAHPMACPDLQTFKPAPGLIATFIPRAVEYVVAEDDPAEKLENLITKGATLVQIERIDPEPPLPGMSPP